MILRGSGLAHRLLRGRTVTIDRVEMRLGLLLSLCAMGACGHLSPEAKTTMMVAGGVLAASGVAVLASNEPECAAPDCYDVLGAGAAEDAVQGFTGMLLIGGGAALLLTGAIAPTVENSTDGQARLARALSEGTSVPAEASACLEWRGAYDAEPDPARRRSLLFALPSVCDPAWATEGR